MRRRLLSRAACATSQRLPVPVVVVGNLIVGGAGKTPTVLALVEMLRRHGRTPGIVSRGYGGAATACAEVARADASARGVRRRAAAVRLRTGVPVVVGADRVAAARALLRAPSRGRRDGQPTTACSTSRCTATSQVIVFDERGAGNGWLLPAGPLREPLPRARAAAPASCSTTRARRRRRCPASLAQRALAGAVAARRLVARASRAARDGARARCAAAASSPPPAWRGPSASSRCCARRPAHRAELPLPDHFDYATLPWPADAADVVVTEKDAVKLRPARGSARRASGSRR